MLNFGIGGRKVYTLPSVIISGCKVICCEILEIDMTLPANPYILLKGIVYSPKGEPLPHAAVEVLQIDKSVYPEEERSIGVTFTNEEGSYGITLPRCEPYDYKLVAYSALYCLNRQGRLR
jgi:hypothetical protein